jgi:4-carboxymuconolactone decarboxylase
MNTDQIRVPLVVPGTRPDLSAIEARILSERGRISLLYQALLNSEAIATGWEAMLTAVRNRTGVSPAIREMIILRVAVLNDAGFEFDAHVPHALKAGFSQEKIDALRDPMPSELFDEEERLLLELTDCMTRDVKVPEALVSRVTARHDPKTVVELVATVAAYNMVSRFLVALNIAH